MFLGVLSWMLAHVPSFMRPGVNWLVDGLRRITGHIASVWNALGASVGALYVAVANWRGQLAQFVVTVAHGLWWLRNVYVPGRLNALQSTIVGLINSAVNAARNNVMAVVLGLERWISDRVYELGRLIGSLTAWATTQLARVDVFLATLLRMLAHVTSGPVVLAEWLIGALYQAALRRLYAERDRIFQWLFRSSQAFTRWLADVIEDMIVRML